MIDTNAQTATRISSSQLQPGDVLLMMGDAPISQLIAWCGDSIYSHAALMADDGDLIEASGSGVRRYPLAQRLQDTTNYYFVDAFRPLSYAQNPLDSDDRALVLAHAVSLLGVPYPIDELATLGVIVAVRGKLPEGWLERLVVREALDHLVRDDPSHMVCSEVVYRCFAECATEPAGRLAPEIILEPRGDAPFPKIDWTALFKELWELLHPARRQALQAIRAQFENTRATATPNALQMPNAAQAAAPSVADDELQGLLQQARDKLGTATQAKTTVGLGAPSPNPVPIPNPNPKLVTPLDLASTPSHTALGRLMQRSTA